MTVTKKKNGGRHMRRKVGRKVISTVLSAALITSGIAFQSGDVSAAKKVTKLTLNKKSAILYNGADKAYSSITLKATVKPKKSAKVKFTTSNKKIATVSAKGVVKAKKAGKVTITAKAGNKKTVCKITVKKVSKKIKKITVKKSKVTVYVGKTSKISTTVTPKKVTIKKLTYKTSNKKVATVSASGVIKGVKAGKAKITVAAIDGSKKKATVTVTVTEHTLRSYSTYIRSYLDYLQNILHKSPEDGFLAGTPRLHQMDSKRTESCGQNHQYSYFTASFLYHLCFT